MEETNVQEIETYPLVVFNYGGNEIKFAEATICNNSNELKYCVNEIELEEHESDIYYEILKRIKKIDKEKNLRKLSQQDAFRFIDYKIKETCHEMREDISTQEKTRIKYFLYKNYFGFGEIEPLFYDKDVKYIFCERPGLPIYIFHKNPRYGFMKTNIVLRSIREYKLISENLKLKSKKLRESPDFFGILEDKQVVEVSDSHREFSITRFSKMPTSPRDMVKLKLIRRDVLVYLYRIIKNRGSVLIIGGNSSQRIQLANSLALLTDKKLKAVIFEKTPSIILPHNDAYYKVLPLYEKKHKHVIKEYLRKNPELVISAEIETNKQTIKNIKHKCQTFITIEANDLDNAIKILNNEVPAPWISYIDVIVKIKESIGWPRVDEIYEITAYDAQSKMLMISPIFYNNVLRKSKLLSQQS